MHAAPRYHERERAAGGSAGNQPAPTSGAGVMAMATAKGRRRQQSSFAALFVKLAAGRKSHKLRKALAAERKAEEKAYMKRVTIVRAKWVDPTPERRSVLRQLGAGIAPYKRDR